jgi:hypothetical protein
MLCRVSIETAVCALDVILVVNLILEIVVFFLLWGGEESVCWWMSSLRGAPTPPLRLDIHQQTLSSPPHNKKKTTISSIKFTTLQRHAST